MRPDTQAKRDKVREAATDLLDDYKAEATALRHEIESLGSALAMKQAELAMITDQITQISRAKESLDRE